MKNEQIKNKIQIHPKSDSYDTLKKLLIAKDYIKYPNKFI